MLQAGIVPCLISALLVEDEDKESSELSDNKNNEQSLVHLVGFDRVDAVTNDYRSNGSKRERVQTIIS